eukprot:349060_1
MIYIGFQLMTIYLNYFFLSSLQRTEFDQIDNKLHYNISGEQNLLSTNIFKLYKNVKEITIYSGNKCDQYVFSLVNFLEVIKSTLSWSSWSQIIIKVKRNIKYKYHDSQEEQKKHQYFCDVYGDKYRFLSSWIHNLWNSDPNIQQQYNDDKLQTSLMTSMELLSYGGGAEDCLIISRNSNYK